MSDMAATLLGYATGHFVLSAIIALVALVLVRTSRMTPEVRANALVLAMMFCVVAPLLPSATIDWRDGGTIAGEVRPSSPAVATSSMSLTDLNADTPVHREGRSGSVRIDRSIALCLVAIWLIGIAWKGARLARSTRETQRIVIASKRSRQLESDFRDILPNGVEIRLSDAHGPAVVGVLRPRILIPHALADHLPDASLRAIVLHEAAHVERRDPLVYACQMMAETALWWNPVFRWMARVLDSTREIACDLRASRSTDSAFDYAEALLDAIERMGRNGCRSVAPALGVTSALHSLDRRIEDIIEERQPMGVTVKLALTMLALMATGVWFVADAALPQLDVRPDVADTPANRTAPALRVGAASTPARDIGVEESADANHHRALLILHAEHKARLAQIHDDHRSAITDIEASYSTARSEADPMPAGPDYERRMQTIGRAYDDAMTATGKKFNDAQTQADNAFESAMHALDADYAQQSKEHANRTTTAS